MALTVGFPRMHRETGERRDFLPDLVGRAAALGVPVSIERGIGSGMGLSDQDYLTVAPQVRVVDHATAFRQDIVVVLRSPEVEEFDKLRSGTLLVSMLHLNSRPRRVKGLLERGVDGLALDCIVGDDGRRLVENTRAVAWNGLEVAFAGLERVAPERLAPGAPPLRVTLLGAGQVGKPAVEAATKYGSLERFAAWSERGVPAAEVTVLGRRLTGDPAYMQARFQVTDILVDATQRPDPSRPLIPNEWIAWLPARSVICDLVVDPYVPTGVPPTVRSIEGIPRGDLDQYLFLSDDPGWCRTIPPEVPTVHRRTVASCYSWPGLHPRSCMELYGRQLWPLLERVIARGGLAGAGPEGDALDRALWRGSLQRFAGA